MRKPAVHATMRIAVAALHTSGLKSALSGSNGAALTRLSSAKPLVT